MTLPRRYRRKVRWLPQIGDLFPDFEAPTTEGPIRFHGWAEGHWTVLFGQPGAFTPVCTTELAGLARAAGDFAARKTRPIGLLPNTAAELVDWCAEVERVFGDPVGFPLIGDETAALARLCGMTHPKAGGSIPIRKTFLIDPALRIRMIFEYPQRIGRATDEVLRCLDALRAQDAFDIATPADWTRGENFLAPSGMTAEAANRAFGEDWTELLPYLRVVNAAMLDPAARPPDAIRPPPVPGDAA
ncbi:redoxin domain-containing protein [Rhodovulum sp. ES.010]|uniref:redoxin domain-containing protein n=1 Tax=Rhodovulum sp. ES.010 TaxID=1882821 RepID=UPI0015882555|nr:redoxin domain-containing protein [Rhodovulum sp. ES.010]